jgi:hypothetical protein
LDNSIVEDLGSDNGEAQLHKLVGDKLDDIKKTRLKIPVRAKNFDRELVVKQVVVRDQICKVVRRIQSVSGFIGTTLSLMPHAAIA